MYTGAPDGRQHGGQSPGQDEVAQKDEPRTRGMVRRCRTISNRWSPARVRKTPSWPRSWANFRRLSLYSHRNASANLLLLGQANTFRALEGQDEAAQEDEPRTRRHGVGRRIRLGWLRVCIHSVPVLRRVCLKYCVLVFITFQISDDHTQSKTQSTSIK